MSDENEKLQDIIARLEKISDSFNNDLDKVKDLLNEATDIIDGMINVIESNFTDDELDAIVLKNGTLSEIIDVLEDISTEIDDAIDDLDSLTIDPKDLDEEETLEALQEIEEEEEEEEEEE
ncbi:MAG: hypothetical protein ACP6IS_01915 [Candidatus Asgardarchaeia archaeon]